MNKKIILFAVMLINALLISCGRNDASASTLNKSDDTENNSSQLSPKPENPNPQPSPNPDPSPKPDNPQPSKPEEKPTEDDLKQRTYSNKWKVAPEVYLERIDIADLYNNPNAITIDILKELVTFETQDGNKTKHYTLTEEDLSQIEIVNLKYDRARKRILFYTKYKGNRSLVESGLSFDYIKFYERKITVNTEYVRNHYMRGTYQYLSIGNVLNIDENIFEFEERSINKTKDDGQNEMTVSIELTDKRIQEKFPISLTKQISGFRTLQDLANDLQIASSAELLEKVKEKMKNYNKNGADITNYLKNTFIAQKWITYSQITLKSGGELEWNEDSTVLLRRNGLDIYLENPNFILKSAILEEKNLRMTVEFQQANEQAINKEYTFVVPNVK